MASNIKPNKDRLRMWARALKSGQYQQGKGYMRTNDGKYCCLGVAMDLALANGCPVTGMENWGKSAHLPESVVAWYGLKSQRVYLQSPVAPDRDAADLNDTAVSFPKIADRIIYTFGLDQED